MAIKDFLTQPAAKVIAIRTAKNILIIGLTATAAYFSNNVFKLSANNALQSAMEDYTLVRSMMRS